MNTTYFLNTIAGNVFNTQPSPVLPKIYYLGVSTSNPGTAGTAVKEPTGGNYARIQLTGLSAPTNGVVSNSAELRSNKASAAWGNVTHYVIYDALTGGNLLMHGPLNRARQIEIDTILIFEKGELKLKVQNPA